jgi:hypothetical protein
MLRCDDCDQGYHVACLRPPLSVVPVGAWLCSRCDRNRTRSIASDW